jgi:phenylacetate-coenzyme A ligase PaaK-like adenylate-forming protein
MFREFLSFDELRKLSWNRIEHLQNRRLAAAAKHLLPHAAFYREFFEKHKTDPSKITCVEDWKKLGLPLIKKKIYIERPRDFIVRPKGTPEQIFFYYLKYILSLSKTQALRLLLSGIASKARKSWYESLTKEVKSFFRPKMPAFAGGTESGRPVPVLITAKQKLQNMVNTADISAYLIVTRHFEESEKGIIAMNLFPYAPHIAWQIINMAAELRTDLNLCTAAGGFLGTEKLVTIAKSSKPNVYCGMVDYLINIFLPKAREEGVELEGSVVFLNGANKMLEVQRRQIKKMLKELGAESVIALDGYGASELKEATLAECEEGSGLHHVSPFSNIIRTVKVGNSDPDSDYIYDWDFTSNEEGGYAAIWNIDGAGTLLEGYLLGDHYEKITTNSCPHCGLNVMRVYNVNRIADLETEMKIMGINEEKISGTRVNLTALREQLLQINGLKEVQLVLFHSNPKDELIVKYAPLTEDVRNIEDQIREVFKKYSDVHPSQIQKIDLSDLYNDKELKYNGIIRKKKHGVR